MSSPEDAPPRSAGVGIVLAIVAYLLWGFLPLFFLLLVPANALEIVAWRVLFSLVFCAILLAVTRSWTRLFGLLRDRRVALTLLLAGVMILINWLVYVFATTNHEVVQASLGYFANPIVTVLLGIFVLRERLRPLQWISIGISAVAVVIIAVGYGAFPWIALALAFSFGLYGLIKKRVGERVDALSGLTIETLWLAPIAIAQLVFVGLTTGITIGHISVLQTISMSLAGVVTAVPLLLFAGAARRLPLTTLGLTQYLTPVLQFLIGVLLLHEAMPPVRLVGFILVWIALIVLTIDRFAASRRPIVATGPV
ncbi:MAG TPA: EamA family transporter RarD [Galbitalea sp.]|jgi:chloramphenicol-sensitive protein RarD